MVATFWRFRVFRKSFIFSDLFCPTKHKKALNVFWKIILPYIHSKVLQHTKSVSVLLTDNQALFIMHNKLEEKQIVWEHGVSSLTRSILFTIR